MVVILPVTIHRYPGSASFHQKIIFSLRPDSFFAHRQLQSACAFSTQEHGCIIPNEEHPSYVLLSQTLQPQNTRTYHMNEPHQWDKLSLDGAVTLLERLSDTASVSLIVHTLQKCRKEKHLTHAKRLHSYIRCHDLEEHATIGNYLVPALVDCGCISDAKQVFEILTVRNEHSWMFLIQGYIDHGEFQHALDLYERMVQNKIHFNRYTLQLILKACARLKNVEKGREVHVQIMIEALENNRFVSSALVDMYAKCGSLEEAEDVLDESLVQDVVSWTALTAGYAEHGQYQKALQCLEKMQLLGTPPDAVTFVFSLKACICLCSKPQGQMIHTQIAKVGLEVEPFIASVLIDMYTKHGLLEETEDVFARLSERDVVLWNVLIGAYADLGHFDKALTCLEDMQQEGVSPNALTFISSLKGCDGSDAMDVVRFIHGKIATEGLERDHVVGNALVDLYSKCGSLADAKNVFNKLSARNVVSWTALISGYVEYGFGREALEKLEQMRLHGVSPNDVTHVCSLKACGIIGHMDKGREIHKEIAVDGYEGDIFIGNTLVDMYARLGTLVDAKDVFDELNVRDVVSWNSLSSRYSEHGLDEEVLQCLEDMEADFVTPDVLSYVCALKSCGSIGALNKGQKVHSDINKGGLEGDPRVSGSLVDMYAKCGSLIEALYVFDDLDTGDIVIWNALISGYACEGHNEPLFLLVEQMILQNVYPNGITFLSVLTVCSHVGIVFEGQEFLQVLSEECAHSLTIEHYNCIVDLLGRAGRLEEAVTVMNKMPFQPNMITWSTLLGSCRKWGDIKLARMAFENAYKSNEKHDALFISMSRIYAAADMWEDAEMIESMRPTKACLELE